MLCRSEVLDELSSPASSVMLADRDRVSLRKFKSSSFSRNSEISSQPAVRILEDSPQFLKFLMDRYGLMGTLLFLILDLMLNR